MVHLSKSDQLASAIAKAVTRLISYDKGSQSYQRISKKAVRAYVVNHKLDKGISLNDGIWRTSWNKAIDRLRHAQAAKEATNWNGRKTTISRSEIEIIDAAKVKKVASDLRFGRPEMPKLRVQPSEPVDKIAVAITQQLEDAMFFAGLVNAEILNEGDVKFRVQDDNRSIWSNKVWPEAWQRVTDYLVNKNALVRREKKTQFMVNDVEEIHALALNPSNVAIPSGTIAPIDPLDSMPSKPEIHFVPQSLSLRSSTDGNTLHRKIGYVRLSLKDSDESQYVSQLEAKGVDNLYIESRSSKREQWELLTNYVREGDTVIVPDLPSMTQSTREAVTTVQWLLDHKINFSILTVGRLIDFGPDGNLTPISRAMVGVFLAFGVLERASLVERTQAGKAHARTHVKGYKEGRNPVLNQNQLAELIAFYEDHTVKETTSKFGISRATLFRRISEFGNQHKHI